MTKTMEKNQSFYRGKIGALTTYKRNGKDYIRLSESVKDKSHSPAQLKQRSKFQVATHYFPKLSPVFKIGFHGCTAAGQNSYNAGMSYNIQKAIDTTENGFEVNWSAVKVSNGALPNVEKIEMEQEENQILTIHWKANKGSGISKTNDNVVITFYNIDKPAVGAIMTPNLTRSTEVYNWNIPAEWIGDKIMIYLFTYQKETDSASESAFIGEITI